MPMTVGRRVDESARLGRRAHFNRGRTRMAEKSKKPAKMANRNVGAEAIKDDGDKYVVVRDGVRVYGGGGVALGEAVRLATSLAAGAGISRVGGDGSLTQGSLNAAGEFVAYEPLAA
jgi:hypothetical protein